MCDIHTCCVFVHVYFVLFLFCLPICVCVWNQVQGLLRECPKYIRKTNPCFGERQFPVSDMCSSCMLRVYGCVFRSIPRLFVYLRMRMSSNSRSIAGVLFDSAGRFRASLLLLTNCISSWCNWIASCVLKWQTKTVACNWIISFKFSVSVKKMGEGNTGGASDIHMST